MSSEVSTIDGIYPVEVRALESLRDNPRGALDPQDTSINELAESINAHGLLQPLVITPDGIIIAGHRRRLACELVGLERVQVVIRNLNEREQLEVMLIENIQRRDLNNLQIAQALQKLSEQGLSVRDIAPKVGMHYETVRKHLGVVRLPAELHPMFASGELALGYVFPLLDLPTPQKQIELAKKAAAEGWLVNQMMAAVNQITRPPQQYVRPSKEELRQEAISEYIEKLAKIRNGLAQYVNDKTALVLIGKAEDALTDYLMQIGRKRT